MSESKETVRQVEGDATLGDAMVSFCTALLMRCSYGFGGGLSSKL